jgi:hypothetical protein
VIEALEIFANPGDVCGQKTISFYQAYQGEAKATRRERDRLAQLHWSRAKIQRAPDVPARLQIRQRY